MPTKLTADAAFGYYLVGALARKHGGYFHFANQVAKHKGYILVARKFIHTAIVQHASQRSKTQGHAVSAHIGVLLTGRPNSWK